MDVRIYDVTKPCVDDKLSGNTIRGLSSERLEAVCPFSHGTRVLKVCICSGYARPLAFVVFPCFLYSSCQDKLLGEVSDCICDLIIWFEDGAECYVESATSEEVKSRTCRTKGVSAIFKSARTSTRLLYLRSGASRPGEFRV